MMSEPTGDPDKDDDAGGFPPWSIAVIVVILVVSFANVVLFLWRRSHRSLHHLNEFHKQETQIMMTSLKHEVVLHVNSHISLGSSGKARRHTIWGRSNDASQHRAAQMTSPK